MPVCIQVGRHSIAFQFIAGNLLGGISDLLALFGPFIKYIAIFFLSLFVLSLIITKAIKFNHKYVTHLLYISLICFLVFSLLFFYQKKLQKSMIDIKENSLNIISPYSNKQITGVANKEDDISCFTQYDGGDPILRSNDHRISSQILQKYLNKSHENNLSYKESSEIECQLAFRLSHFDSFSAVKHFKQALLEDPNNIGALMGLAINKLDNKYLEQAYQIAEKHSEVNAFPYIIYVDVINKHQNQDNINRDRLIETGLKISTDLNLKVMVDRFNEIRIGYQIEKLDDEDAIALIKGNFNNCNSHPTYIDKIRCQYIRSRLFNKIKNKNAVIAELKTAIGIAEEQQDIVTSSYLNIELLRASRDETIWRETENKLLELSVKLENVGNWDLLQMIWFDLANQASLNRQNPKLALVRIQKSIEYLKKLFGSNADSLLSDKLFIHALETQANYAIRSGENKIELDALTEVIKLADRSGDRVDKITAYSHFISAYTRQKGIAGQPLPVELQPTNGIERYINELSALAKKGELDKFELESLINNPFSYSYPEKFILLVNYVCDSNYKKIKDSLMELKCLNYYETILSITNSLDNTNIGDNYPKSQSGLIEKTINLLRNNKHAESEINDNLIQLSHIYKFEKKYKKAFDINAKLINLPNIKNQGEISGELVDLAIELNDKESLLKYLPKVEAYWRSSQSKGYEWSGILRTLSNAFQYLNEPYRELSYLCTAYIQSFKGEGWFENWHVPSTMTKILLLNYENKEKNT